MSIRLATPIYNAARMLIDRGIHPSDVQRHINSAEQPTKGYVYMDDLPSPTKVRKHGTTH